MNSTAIVNAEQNAPAEITISERFSRKMIAEYAAGSTEKEPVSDFARSLINGYFVTIDRALATAEADRLKKNANNRDHKYDNPVSFCWQNVDLPKLAQDLICYAKIGLDMTIPNMLYPVPYADKVNGRVTLTLTPGYAGKKLMAFKYADVPPIDIIAKCVHANDVFVPHPRDGHHQFDTYDFEIANPFDRGEIVGGFAYLVYDDARRNRLIIMSRAEILKRKPKSASSSFWGGTDRDGSRIDGWEEEMFEKTLIRAACGSKYITVDPAKIDASYRSIAQQEIDAARAETETEIAENANAIPLDVPEPVALPTAETADPAEEPDF